MLTWPKARIRVKVATVAMNQGLTLSTVLTFIFLCRETGCREWSRRKTDKIRFERKLKPGLIGRSTLR